MVLKSQMVSWVQQSVVVLSPIPSQRFSIRSQNQKDDSAGVGFGSADTATANSRKRKQKEQRERASIIRRTPLQKPNFVSDQNLEEPKEQSKNESAFLLAYLGFGLVVFVEGITLAASGFLPEQWDNFLVKYLYPSFTPTVFLFVAGAVAYGVFKYLQNEKIREQK